MSENAPDISRETLDAYIDGELAPQEMTRVAALLVERADLKSYVDRQLALRTRLSDSFAPLMAEKISDQMQQVLRATPTENSAAWRSRLGKYLSWNVAVPMLASLAFGLVVGIAIERSAQTELAFVRPSQSGQVLAQGELESALSEQLASSDQSNRQVRIGISFRSRSGLDCRTFEWLGDKTASNGVACRSGDSWAVAAITTSARTAGDRATYQMAGSTMPDSIRNIVSGMIAGAPYDATAERAARAAHWSGAKRP